MLAYFHLADETRFKSLGSLIRSDRHNNNDDVSDLQSDFASSSLVTTSRLGKLQCITHGEQNNLCGVIDRQG